MLTEIEKKAIVSRICVEFMSCVSCPLKKYSLSCILCVDKNVKNFDIKRIKTAIMKKYPNRPDGFVDAFKKELTEYGDTDGVE